MKKFKKQYLVVPALALTLLAGASIVSVQDVAAANNVGYGKQGEMRGHSPGFGGGMPGMGDFAHDPDQWLSRITADAAILGVSVDEMKTAWSQGKTLQDLATEKGITREQLAEKLKAAAETKQKEALQALVTKGYITQAQADARLAVMKTRQTNHESKRSELKTKLQNRLGQKPAAQN